MVFSASVILFCAVYSIEGEIQGSGKKSVTIDTGWSLERDRYVWGYAETLTPIVKPSLPISQVSTDTEKIITESNQNKLEVNIPSPPNSHKKEGSQSSQATNFQGIYNQKLIEIIQKNATIAKIVYNACSPYEPPVPDFKVPGRRISDVKCQELIWNIKYENERKQRYWECGRLKYTLSGDTRGIPTTIGGRVTQPGEFPHMGAIGWKGINGEWQFKCGSSLISPTYVLTAAHCTRAPESDTGLADPVPKIVRLSYKNIVRGLPSKTKGKFDIEILNIISHPEYIPPRKYYDIALIELKRAAKFSRLVQPSCLWGYSDINKLGAIATLTGWGVLAEGSLDISPELQAAVLDIIDSDKCGQYLRGWCNRNWCGVRDHQLCAGKLAGGVDACQGDSGSPLQVKIPLDIETPYNIYNIIGVTSFGVGCAQPNLPGVYTRVSSFIDWIESIVWPQ